MFHLKYEHTACSSAHQTRIMNIIPIRSHPAVDLKSKETVRFCAILVGFIESSAHTVADHHVADSWSSEESVAVALWE